MTLRPLLLAALLVALASSAGAQAPLQIRLDPQIPVVGLSAEVTAQFFETLPESASLFVRAVGETAYQEFVGVDQGDAFWTVVIDEIPPSGLEVYASYVLDGETFTEPLQNPEAFPFRVPVLVPAITSAVDLPRRQYRMVSVPFVLGANSGLPAVLGSDAPIDVFGDDFGETGDPAQWRLLRWDPLVEDYRDAIPDGELFERIRPGAGYWLITSSGGTFDIDRGLSTGVTIGKGGIFAADVTIPVRTGWNQIGNPFLFPISWDDVRRPIAVEDPVAFTGSFVGGQATLQPWEGYFVFNPGPSGLLRFRASPSQPVAERTLSERVQARAGAGAAALRVTAVSGTSTDEVTIGLQGTDAPLDGPPADLRKPPPVDGSLRLAARADGEDWISHFQPREAATWALTVTPPAGAAVDLRLDRLGDWPDGLVLEDLDTGRVLEVVDGRVRIETLADVPTRRLAVRAGAAAVVDPEVLAPSLGAPHPNPTAGAVTLPVRLSTPGPARLDVVDTLGRTVRSLALDLPGGTSTASWDGLDASGRPVAAGLYLVRLTTEAGTAAVRVTRLR